MLLSVLFFYFTIFAQMFFLTITKCFSFKTLRERSGFGGNLRYKIDFLFFVQHDIHWFLIIFALKALFIYMLVFKISNWGGKDYLLITVMTIRFISNLVVLYVVYFWNKNIFEYGLLQNRKVYLMFGVNLIIDILSCVFLSKFIETNIYWRSTYARFDILLRIFMYISVGFEIIYYKAQVNEWKKSYMLRSQ